MYPLLSKLAPAPSSISTTLRTILLAAGHVASGDIPGVLASYSHIDKSEHAKAYELTIVQAAPIIGIPRALHSASALQQLGVHYQSTTTADDETTTSTSCASIEQMRTRGEQTFEQVYGRNSERVQKRLATFHPKLHDWIITSVYGSCFDSESPLVTMRERELAIVAMLAVDPCASVQLASHIRGAINVGATPQEVEAVINQTEFVCESAAPHALAVWHSYHRARYAL